MNLLTPLLLAVTSGVLAPPGDSLLVEVAGRVTVFHAAELAQLPRDSVRWDYHGTPHLYTGVWLTVLLRRTGVPIDTLRGPNLTRRLVVEAADGYRAVFTLAELAPGLGSRDVLLADLEDGHSLAPWAHGAWWRRETGPAPGRSARSLRSEYVTSRRRR